MGVTPNAAAFVGVTPNAAASVGVSRARQHVLYCTASDAALRLRTQGALRDPLRKLYARHLPSPAGQCDYLLIVPPH